tara:strand:- start:606 stop:884 length:279 start_codon:yes stop_codon:yes gene_type:complete
MRLKEAKSLLIRLLLVLPLVLVAGCAFLPLPLQIASSGKTLYDTARIIENKKTINDELASMMYEQNCKTRNIFEGRAYCIDLHILQAENLEY